VSHALNGKGRVDSDTIDVIRSAAADLGYQASVAARSLRKRRTGLVAILHSRSTEHQVSLIDIAHFISLIAGASKVASDNGYHLTLVLPATSASLDWMQADGVIVIDPRRGDPLLQDLKRRDIAVVTTGRDTEIGEQGLWVDNDNRVATLLVLDHLAANGARNIALLTTPAEYSYSLETIETYRSWCATRGQTPLVRVITGGINETVAFNATIELFSEGNRPDAIHCVTDRYAMGALMAVRSLGLDVPRDCLVTAGTDSDALRLGMPAVTALDLHPAEMGEKAMQMLISSIDGKPLPSDRLLPVRLNVRNTSQRLSR
jgi:DNA-binding LacI/PurR family transcriptional regulator